MKWSDVFKVEDFRTLGLSLAIILLIWTSIALPLAVLHKLAPHYYGTLGDTFDVINSVFSALAFAGLLYTIFLQKKELSETRAELNSKMRLSYIRDLNARFSRF